MAFCCEMADLEMGVSWPVDEFGDYLFNALIRAVLI